jgi:hypothetical protein
MGALFPHTTYSFVYVLLLILFSALISFLYYRNSNLRKKQKLFFIIIRFFSVFFILFLFLSPFYAFFIPEKSINIFLIDGSGSLDLEGRNQSVKNILDENFSNSSGNSENKYMLFSDGILKEIEKSELDKINTDSTDNYETNLNKTFLMLKDYYINKKISSITIISDGILTDGGNPSAISASFGIPINYFLIGDTIQKKDLIVKNVYFDKTSFIDSKTPVVVNINSYGYDKKIKINLFEDEKLADSKIIDINSNEINYTIPFDVFSPNAEIKKYRIEIENEPDEITTLNNYKEFFIKFVDNKLKILVISGGPSPDVAFMTEELKRIKNIESTFLTQKSSTEFYEGKLQDINDFQCVLMVGFPSEATGLNTINELKDKIQKNNASLFFISGSNTQYDKLYPFEELLPFHTNKQTSGEIKTGVRNVISLDNELQGNSLIQGINNLPEIFYPSADFDIKPNSEIILLTTANSKPAFILYNYGNIHSASFLCYGFYKWRLNPENKNADNLLHNLISNTLLSITDKEKTKKIYLETNKQVFGKNENISIKCRLNQPSGNERINLYVSKGKYFKEINLQKIGNTEYDGELKLAEPGNYEIIVELYKDENKIETDNAKISVSINNDEFLITKPDKTILSNLTNITSGENFTGEKNSEIVNSLKNQTGKDIEIIKEFKRFYLNINPVYLIILILLLSVEWFFRKRNNLP